MSKRAPRGFKLHSTTYVSVDKKARLLTLLVERDRIWSFLIHRAKYDRSAGEWIKTSEPIGMGDGFDDARDANEEAKIALARFKL